MHFFFTLTFHYSSDATSAVSHVWDAASRASPPIGFSKFNQIIHETIDLLL